VHVTGQILIREIHKTSLTSAATQTSATTSHLMIPTNGFLTARGFEEVKWFFKNLDFEGTLGTNEHLLN
jgi:hypothetical protein